jgi:hypothetical protein
MLWILLSGCNPDAKVDQDGDGFVASEDCDDTNPDIHPDAQESCDNQGADEDCDGLVNDEDDDVIGGIEAFVDADGDGGGDPAKPVIACTLGEGAAISGTDCNDQDASIYPGADEVCDPDNVDENCNGLADDDDPEATGKTGFWTDADGDGYGGEQSGLGCDPGAGEVTEGGDCDDRLDAANPGELEVCDGLDNDCDGETDEPDSLDASLWFADLDGDGFGDENNTLVACEKPRNYIATAGDCDDQNYYAHPGLLEFCNGYDDDCDGVTDPEGLPTAPEWYADSDGDGYGDEQQSLKQCEAPPGYAAFSGDCDESDPTINPNASEICDGLDNDCDNRTDDADSSLSGAPVWYLDADGDAYGGSSFKNSCTQPAGYSLTAGDCDDRNTTINPDATEICDGQDADEDCDGASDDSDASVDVSTYQAIYEDTDGDGYGDALAFDACDASPGYSEVPGDCDESDAAINPGASERCDSLDTDEDCDGASDDADPDTVAGSKTAFFTDADQDGYGDSSSLVMACDISPGRVEVDGDCDESDATINPGAEDLCGDLVDSDCDNSIACDVSVAEGLAFFEGSRDDYSGQVVIRLGDQNSDGVDEVVAASWYIDGASTDSGAARVLPGNTTGRVDAASVALGTIYGSGSYEYLGIELAAGDFNNDGIDDLVTASPSADYLKTDDGLVSLFSGPISGNLTRNSAYASWYGDTTSNNAGTGLSAADISGDGVVDLIIGAQGYGGYAGAIYLLSSIGSGISDLGYSSDRITGVSSGDYAGAEVMAGDLDGDGVAEVVISANGAGNSSTGEIYIFNGPLSGSLSCTQADATMAAVGPFSVGGVLALGDMNGDGSGDLAASGYYSTVVYTGDGQVQVFMGPFSGNIGRAAVTITGYEDSQFLGASLAAGSDLDGDGSDELLINGENTHTADGMTGAVFVFYGQNNWSGSYSAGEAESRIVHDDYVGYGTSVGFAGDLDGDSLEDLLIGSNGNTSTSASGGMTVIFPGSKLP